MSNVVTCELCQLEMKTRINGSHLKRSHNVSLTEYIKLFPNAVIGKRTPQIKSYTCLICQKNVNGSNSMSKHLKNTHSISLDVYYLKYYLHNIAQLCKCGCNTQTAFNNLETGFHDYIHNHTSPFVKNNTFYEKRKLFDAWNSGLTKQTDVRVKKNATAIKNSWNAENIKQRNNSYKNTMSTKYGVKNGFQLDVVKEKTKKTMMEKYGVENPQFSNTIKYRWKLYTLPSGKIVKCQGYEPFELDILLQTHSEFEIINDRQLLPKIKYIENGKSKLHCPDFFIPSKNLLIDVKSIFTHDLHKKQMSLKQYAAIAAGYEYQIHIFNRNGTINKIL